MENEFLKLWIFACSQAFPTFSDKPIPVFSPKNATLISYCWLFFADPKQVNLSISVGLYKPMTTLRYIVDGGLSNICCTSVPAFRRIRLMTLEVTDFVHSWHCQYHYCHQYLHCYWWMLAIESHQSSLRTRLFLIIVDCVTWYPRRTPWNYHVPNPYLRTPEGIYIYSLSFFSMFSKSSRTADALTRWCLHCRARWELQMPPRRNFALGIEAAEKRDF